MIVEFAIIGVLALGWYMGWRMWLAVAVGCAAAVAGTTGAVSLVTVLAVRAAIWHFDA